MVLLAGVECRPVVIYADGQLLGTLMRHVLLSVAVVLRASGVVEPADAGALMLAAHLALLPPPRRRSALARAVALAAVTPPADEEDLPALGAVADDEA